METKKDWKKKNHMASDVDPDSTWTLHAFSWLYHKSDLREKGVIEIYHLIIVVFPHSRSTLPIALAASMEMIDRNQKKALFYFCFGSGLKDVYPVHMRPAFMPWLCRICISCFFSYVLFSSRSSHPGYSISR